jgi:hypothetical protein
MSWLATTRRSPVSWEYQTTKQQNQYAKNTVGITVNEHQKGARQNLLGFGEIKDNDSDNPLDVGTARRGGLAKLDNPNYERPEGQRDRGGVGRADWITI